jgi:mono/diheme cytochrome c family protein
MPPFPRALSRAIPFVLLLAASGLTGAVAAGAGEPDDLEDDNYHYGVVEYEIACLPCHGIDGRGDGPLADRLEVPPADLTQIAMSNGGEFPVLRLFEMIDGRALVAAHGRREMPVWGDRYRTALPGEGNRAEIETEALARIAALVRYLETLQEAGPATTGE